jgi:choline dehydrogenase-like flavoprotein
VNEFDAVVVGAGIAGCQMARDLAVGGLRVAVLEAGPQRSAAELVTNDGRPTTRADRRRFAREGQHVQARNILLAAHNRRFYVDDRRHPYRADRPFLWFRGRQVGGRSILWSRACLRMSAGALLPHPGTNDWENWPFGPAELAPYYDRVERELGVTGKPAGIEAIPDGAFVAPPPTTPLIAELLDRFRDAASAMQATPARTAMLERSTVPSTLRMAINTGAQLFPNAAVRRIVFEPSARRAEGVEVTTPDGATRLVRCRIVVLCASTIETVRILWQSRSAAHPQGLGNHSDCLGRGIQDHLAINCAGSLRHDLRALDHRSLVDPLDPWREEQASFLVWGREGGPSLSPSSTGAREIDCLASCLLAPDKSFWSLLVLGASRASPAHRIVVERRPGGTEETMARIVHERTADDDARLAALGLFARRVVRAGRLGPIGYSRKQQLMHLVAPQLAMARCRRAPGAVIHETGGARMGVDPEDSVVDPRGRCWDAENVYVADGSVFPSSGFQNPTLTILALSARTAEHVLRTDGHRDGPTRGHSP